MKNNKEILAFLVVQQNSSFIVQTKESLESNGFLTYVYDTAESLFLSLVSKKPKIVFISDKIEAKSLANITSRLKIQFKIKVVSLNEPIDTSIVLEGDEEKLEKAEDHSESTLAKNKTIISRSGSNSQSVKSKTILSSNGTKPSVLTNMDAKFKQSTSETISSSQEKNSNSKGVKLNQEGLKKEDRLEDGASLLNELTSQNKKNTSGSPFKPTKNFSSENKSNINSKKINNINTNITNFSKNENALFKKLTKVLNLVEEDEVKLSEDCFLCNSVFLEQSGYIILQTKDRSIVDRFKEEQSESLKIKSILPTILSKLSGADKKFLGTLKERPPINIFFIKEDNPVEIVDENSGMDPLHFLTGEFLEFSLFLHFKNSNKKIEYVSPGNTLSKEQIDKLIRRKELLYFKTEDKDRVLLYLQLNKLKGKRILQ